MNFMDEAAYWRATSLHHHHGPDGKTVEHAHLMLEGRRGVEDDPAFTGPLNSYPFHEHFDIEGERCPVRDLAECDRVRLGECEECGERTVSGRRGPLRRLCDRHRKERDAVAKRPSQRAYVQRHKSAVAAYQRGYRERRKDELRAKRRAKRGLLCSECGEHVREPGLCGWCAREVAS